MKNRLLLATVITLLAVSASAQMRMHPSMPPGDMGTGTIMNGAMPGAMVTGTVFAAGATTLTLANGLVTIDATAATVVIDGAKSTLASVKSGDFVVATLKTDDVAAGGNLVATIVAVVRQAAVTFAGDIQSVDAANKTLTILGRTVYTDANTSFGGPFGQKTLADATAGSDAMVSANVVNGKLVATSVMVMGAHMNQPPMGGNQGQSALLRGTVKSIAPDSWVVTVGTTDTKVLVNAQTRIIGAPKVGDKVDVMATKDSSGTYVALAIMRSVF